MIKIKEIPIEGWEKVIEATSDSSPLHAFIAIHNTTLGPALGGTRFYPYSRPEEGLSDVLRLSKAMSLKSAVVQDGLGGGKSVIIGDPAKIKSETLLFEFAEVLNSLKGKYIAAEDVGTTEQDMFTLRKKSLYVAAVPSDRSSGDPSRFTAWGVFRGLQALSKYLFNDPSLKNRHIALQGLGNVGSKLAALLFWEGAEMTVSDHDPRKVQLAIHDYGARKASVEEILSIKCDILVPCALGGVFNSHTISNLNCLAIGGSANNQLESPKEGLEIYNKNILYAPDYIINAGGIINAASEFEPGGYNPKISRDRTNGIYETLLTIFKRSKDEKKPTFLIADEIAEYNIKNKIGMRINPIIFE